MTDTITLPRKLAEAIEQSLGSFVSDHGWSQRDMDNMDSLSAALAQQSTQVAQQAEQASCEWKQDPDYECGDTYHSSCGELWSFIDGSPKENRVSYCHHCGKPVKLAPPKGVV